jgi:hypothetical protein
MLRLHTASGDQYLSLSFAAYEECRLQLGEWPQNVEDQGFGHPQNYFEERFPPRHEAKFFLPHYHFMNTQILGMLFSI